MLVFCFLIGCKKQKDNEPISFLEINASKTTLEVLEENHKNQKLDYTNYMKYKAFTYWQKPERIPEEYRGGKEQGILKCGTPIILEYQNEWDKLDTETQEFLRSKNVEPVKELPESN